MLLYTAVAWGTPAKATPSRAAGHGTPAKATPGKATPAKGAEAATPAKATPAKATPAKATPGKGDAAAGGRHVVVVVGQPRLEERPDTLQLLGDWDAAPPSCPTWRVGLMAFIYFNSRVLRRAARVGQGFSWEEWVEWLDSMPPLKRDEMGRLIDPQEEVARAAAAAAAAAQGEGEQEDAMDVY
ncbi:MAG: hypothetical protein J3K34DRAFT_466868 [Monoraphidium minutum]|nr:MAG: hypothetical protein J3K34DRAFT_466868 [Monoraphidium minutum]